VPVRFVVIEVISTARAVIECLSTLSVLIVGVAEEASVEVLLVTLLFVNVLVEEIDGIVTPSTEITPALTLVRVVSLACPRLIAVTSIVGAPVKAVATVLSPVFVPLLAEPAATVPVALILLPAIVPVFVKLPEELSVPVLLVIVDLSTQVGTTPAVSELHNIPSLAQTQ